MLRKIRKLQNVVEWLRLKVVSLLTCSSQKGNALHEFKNRTYGARKIETALTAKSWFWENQKKGSSFQVIYYCF